MNHLVKVILLTLSFNVLAGVEYRPFDSPEQENTYQHLIKELRCLVCQNQTIASSNADLAKDLRRQVYEMLQQGKSSTEIVHFMTQRYGDFVLYNPPLKPLTGFLWLGPIIFLLIGLIILGLLIKRRQSIKPDLSDDVLQKRQQAKTLLNKDRKS